MAARRCAKRCRPLPTPHNADPPYNTKARVEIQFVVSGTSEQSPPDRLAAAYQAGGRLTPILTSFALDDSGISRHFWPGRAKIFIPIDTSKIPQPMKMSYSRTIS